jgi:hypothetical protein
MEHETDFGMSYEKRNTTGIDMYYSESFAGADSHTR